MVIVDENKQPASKEIVDAVQKFLSVDAGSGDRKAPIGATVTVVPATKVDVDVEATVVLDSDAGTSVAEVQESFTKALDDYLKRLAFKTGTIRYSRICSILLEQPGVVDYSKISVNGQEVNISVSDEEVATIGAVTLHAS